MNQQIPSVEDFLAQQETDDELTGTEEFEAAIRVGPATLWQVPKSDLQKIAEGVQRLVEHFTTSDTRAITVYEAMSPEAVAAEIARVNQPTEVDAAPHTWARKAAEAGEALQLSFEKLADAEDQLKAMADVIYSVEAALGKSTAKPSLAAKAVIEAWRNPQVPEVEGTAGGDSSDLNIPAEHLPGHTRAEVEEGAPAICQECSYAAQDYVVWPCPEVKQAFEPLAPTEPEGVEDINVQPAHDAPVEEWRAYARRLGYAGPDIDKANRSVIRTTLGIAHVEAQPAPEGGA